MLNNAVDSVLCACVCVTTGRIANTPYNDYDKHKYSKFYHQKKLTKSVFIVCCVNHHSVERINELGDQLVTFLSAFCVAFELKTEQKFRIHSEENI